MEINGVEIKDTYAEGFGIKVTRILVTAATARLAKIAATEATGYGTSVIGCPAEAGIDCYVPAECTPDGRPGYAIMICQGSKKALDHEIELSDDVVKFIADNIKKSIRQIEGIIKRIKAYQDVEGIKINLSLAKRAISDIINDSQPLPVTVENIINEVSRTFNVSAADIRSDKRNANISQARQIAIYIVDQVTGLSLKAIGSEFGNKHHSTIIYALKEIKTKLEKDVALKSTVDDIIKNINENWFIQHIF